MARDSARPRRVGDQIRRDLAELMTRELSDPRIGLVTITDVEVSGDLGHAKVFVSLPRDADATQVMAGLTHATPWLRRALAPRLRLRIMPTLKFHQDKTVDEADRIGQLLADATRRHSGEGQ